MDKMKALVLKFERMDFQHQTARGIVVLDTGCAESLRHFKHFRGRIQGRNFFTASETDDAVPDPRAWATDEHGHGTFIMGMLVHMTYKTGLYMARVSDGRSKLTGKASKSAVKKVRFPGFCSTFRGHVLVETRS
jgi:hypothetical protein